MLAKKYAENLVEALLKLASNQNTFYYVEKEIEVEWICSNQLYVTGFTLDKKGNTSESGTTLKALLGIFKKNNQELITATEAKVEGKSEKEIEKYIIEQIRNSIRYLEELKLLQDQRPRNHNGKVAGKAYWKFKLINLKDKNVTLEVNLNEVRKKLGLPPQSKTILPEAQISTLQVPSVSNPLAQQMMGWFKTLGYQFEGYEVWQDSYFEWIINIPIRRNRYDRILVRGMTGEIGLKDVRLLSSKVKEKRTDEGWLVTDRRISKMARCEVQKKENCHLECYTFDQLVAIDADFSGYLNWLEAEVKRRGIDKRYVPLACSKEELGPVSKRCIGVSHYTEEDGWIDGYINRWLDDPVKEHISILGEFGTGKTWFALHYAWVALQRYRDAEQSGVQLPRLPLVISLRDYAKAVSVESLFSEFFFRQHEIPIPGYSAFEQLNRMGKLLLIFDGFDEMAVRINRQEMINNFWELAKVVVPGAKVILTCRTEHFPEAKEGRALLNAELQASVANLTGETPQFEILELEKFNNKQIRQVLSHQAQDTTVELVMGNPQLLDLSRRPVMSELILEALPDIEAGKPIDISRVYLYAVRRKMERDIKAERTFTSLADKLYFLCELSWEMLSNDKMSLNYRQFPARIRRLFGAIVEEEKDLDHWHYDMMGQTMLIRNAHGDYTPAHRSLLEFFVAYKFASELGVLAGDFTKLAQAQEYLNNHPPNDYTWSSYFRRNVDATGNIISVAPLQGFISESLEELLKTVGKTPLTKAVMDLLVPMVADNQALIRVLEVNRGRSEDDVGYVGGNVTTLAVKVNKRALEGRDFSGAIIKRADFSDASLRNVNFAGANLADSTFTKIFAVVLSVAFSPDGKLFATGNSNGVVSLWDTGSGKEILTCKGHTNWIYSVAFSPDGKTLASSSNDKIVRLWNVNNGECFQILRGHTNKVYSVAFSPDGKTFASSSADQTVRLWNVNNWECFQILQGHTNGVCYITFSPNESILASGSKDQTIRLWDISCGKCFHTLQGHTKRIYCIAFSPDGTTLVSGSEDKTIRLWNISNGKCLHILQGHNHKVYSVACSADGTTLASGSADQTVRLWNISSGECLHILQGHTNWVRSVAFSPDEVTLASGGADQTVRLWNISSGQCLHTFEGKTKRVRSISFHPNGETLASGSDDQMIRLWDISSGQCLHTFEGTSRVYSVAWSPDGATLASGSDDQTIRLWNISSGECLHILQGHTNWVHSISFHPNGLTLASGSDDQTIRLWNISSGECFHIFEGHTDEVYSVAWSPNGVILASCSDDKTIRLWDISSGECLHILQGHTNWIHSIAFSPDGTTLASSGGDQTVRLWSISSGECLHILQGHTNWVHSLAFSPDGIILASGGGDQTVRLWNINNGYLQALQENINWVYSVAFSLDKKTLASGSDDGTIKLWDVKTGKCLKTLRIDKPYEGMNITDVKGLTSAEVNTLKALGAIEKK